MASKQLRETLSLDRVAFKERALNELKELNNCDKARAITECLDHFIKGRAWVDRINLDDIAVMITQSNGDNTVLVESVINQVSPRAVVKPLKEGTNSSDWDLMRKAKDFTQEEVLKALKGVVSTKMYNDIKNDYKIAKLRQLTKPEQEKVAKKLGEKKTVTESLVKPLKESSLLEGTSNFGSLEHFPLLVYIPYDDFYDSLEYVDECPKMGDFDNEDDYYDAYDKFVDDYYEKYYKGVALLTDEDVANLENDIDAFNAETKDVCSSMEEDKYYDNSDLEDVRIKLEPGYYEGVQVDVEHEKYLDYLDEDVKQEQLARFNKFFEDIKSKYGLTSLSVAYRFSNGETGYKIEEKLKEEVQLNENEDKTVFGLSTGNTPILDAGLYYSFLGELVPSRADEPERFKEFENCVMECAKPILDELVKKSGDFEVVSVDGYYHPKYYNYETDELDFTVKYTGDELGSVIENYSNNEDFIKFLQNYKSYDGFISFFADNRDEFITQEYGKSVAQILKYNVSQEEYERANEELYYDVADCGFYPTDEEDEFDESFRECDKAPKQEEVKEPVKEGYYDYLDKDYGELLDSDVDVYDVKQYVLDETDNKFRTHYTDKYAIYVCANGKGCVVDYEAVGQDFDNVDDNISFGVEENNANEYVDEQGNKHHTINLMATHRLNTTPKEIIEKAPKETMKFRDFFRKYKYNDRCASNFKSLAEYIKKNDDLSEYHKILDDNDEKNA